MLVRTSIIMSLLFCLFATTSVKGQEVALEAGVIYINNRASYHYDISSSQSELFVYTLNTEDELIYISENFNGSISVRPNSYISFYVAKQDLRFNSYTLGSKPFKNIIQVLVQKKILSNDGTLCREAMRNFAAQELLKHVCFSPMQKPRN
ncbi:exported hypothetical protein [Tenacibaculum litopenaei]|uniref:hypothetical protein n=1 Tax=Tenacibaculum litopenaei TaxID=396016 RepID=UPI003893DFB6